MKTTLKHTKYACQGIEIDPVAGCVIGQTETIRLGPVNMRVLEVLVENAGRVVSRAEIFDVVWENQIVSDDVLTRCISDLRKQLGGMFANEKVIETLPKRGYRWTLSVSALEKDSVKAIDRIEVDDKHAELEESSEAEAKIALSIKPQSTISLDLTTSRLVIFALAGLLVLSTSTLWIVDAFYSTGSKKVAFLPIETSQKNTQLAAEVERLLLSELLENNGLKVLAKSAITNRPQNHFTYFTREFGTDWIIESSITQQKEGARLTLNLVDARSATVSHSQSKILSDSDGLKNFCLSFSKKLSQLSD